VREKINRHVRAPRPAFFAAMIWRCSLCDCAVPGKIPNAELARITNVNIRRRLRELHSGCRHGLDHMYSGGYHSSNRFAFWVGRHTGPVGRTHCGIRTAAWICYCLQSSRSWRRGALADRIRPRAVATAALTRFLASSGTSLGKFKGQV